MTTRVHGLLDYMMGIFLLLTPLLFSFPGGAPTTILFSVGILIVLLTLTTNYERGIVKIIPMNLHLAIDILTGLFLVISPWIFGFSDILIWPFVLLGTIEIIIAVLTLGHPPKPYHTY